MNRFCKYLSCALALTFCALPAAACAKTDDTAAEDQTQSRPLIPLVPALPQPPEQTPEQPPEPVATYVRVKTDGLNVRTGAGTQFSSLGRVERGVLLACEQQDEGWYRTQYRGRTAYVSADEQYTEPFTMSMGDERTERIVAEGLRLLGTAYVYGAVRYHNGKGKLLSGFRESAFDCSSLMQYIFYRGADILLEVNTRTQIYHGTPVAKADIRRGDLLFFTNAARKDKEGVERVGHVALYLGDNYILHTASDYAKIEQMSKTRHEYYLTARRMYD